MGDPSETPPYGGAVIAGLAFLVGAVLIAVGQSWAIGVLVLGAGLLAVEVTRAAIGRRRRSS